MNNADFKKLLADTPRTVSGSTPKAGLTSSQLGSKNRSSIPMTPRTVKNGPSVDFARQLAERENAFKSTPKFRSSAAPKGTKLAQGYHDRVRERETTAEDERQGRIQALEEQMKLGQIDERTFETLRNQITGGDIGATHLVKGLDRQLLERVRRGEDVLHNKPSAPADADETVSEDAESAFERLEQVETVPIKRQQIEKKGEMAPPPKPVSLSGQKRSRNEILAEFRASRKSTQGANEGAGPGLGSKFRKLGSQIPYSRIERDRKGREVLITVDEEGRVKRKVRKTQHTQDGAEQEKGLLAPDKNAKPLGLDVEVEAQAAAAAAKAETAAKQTNAEDEDDDIFQGVGASYDPLRGEGEEQSDSSSEEGEETEAARQSSAATAIPDSEISQERDDTVRPTDESAPSSTSVPPSANFTKRDYFKAGRSMASNDNEKSSEATSKPFSDPTIQIALKRAVLERKKEESDNKDDPASDAKRKPSSAAERLFAQRDRDYEDMDMGFGFSRGEDEDDGNEGGSKVRLSEWKGAGMDESDNEDNTKQQRSGRDQRKRGKKKKKGDKNSASDILKVIEGRRNAA